MSLPVKLDLLNNSISYFQEAVNCVQTDEPDNAKWKFAIVHVVQAMELAFKEYLRRIHPLFIYESIDQAKHTISLEGAVERLRNPVITDVIISDREKERISNAIQLRNELTHFTTKHPREYIEAKFAEIFAFMLLFYRTHLGLSPSDFVDDAQHQRIITLVKARAEMKHRIKDYLKKHRIVDVWICPRCDEGTFVMEKEECFLCHYQQKIVECPTCGTENFENELIETDYLVEWNDSAGDSNLADDLELEYHACPQCLDGLKQKVEDARYSSHFEDVMREAMGK